MRKRNNSGFMFCLSTVERMNRTRWQTDSSPKKLIVQKKEMKLHYVTLQLFSLGFWCSDMTIGQFYSYF